MLDQIVGIWKRRKWIAVVAFAAPAAVVVGLATSLPNVYRSTATVLVERQQVPEAFVRPTVTGEVETRLQTMSQAILSRSRLAGLITRFDLYPELRGYMSIEELVDRMRKDIVLVTKSDDRSSAGGPKTVAFTVSYRGGDPVTVAEVTNTLASFYVEENARVRARQATGTAEFLRARLDETKKRLDVLERRVSEYTRRHIGELPQQMTTNLAALETLGGHLRVNSDRQTLAMARREALERQLGDAELIQPRPGPAAIVSRSGVPVPPEAAAVRLERLRQELTELRTQYTERYPEVARVKAEISALERELRGKPATSASSDAPLTHVPVPLPDPTVLRIKGVLSEIDAELKALKDDERRLQGTIARYHARVESTPQREQEFQELSRDYQTTKEHYETLLKRYQEAQLAEDMEQRQKGEQFAILDRGVASHRPAAPDRIKFLFMGLVGSVALAAGAVWLAEQLDTSFHGLDEVRAFTPVPVLVNIPTILAPADLAARRRRVWLALALIVLSVSALGGAAHRIGDGNEWLVGLLSRGGV